MNCVYLDEKKISLHIWPIDHIDELYMMTNKLFKYKSVRVLSLSYLEK